MCTCIADGIEYVQCWAALHLQTSSSSLIRSSETIGPCQVVMTTKLNLVEWKEYIALGHYWPSSNCPSNI